MVLACTWLSDFLLYQWVDVLFLHIGLPEAGTNHHSKRLHAESLRKRSCCRWQRSHISESGGRHLQGTNMLRWSN